MSAEPQACRIGDEGIAKSQLSPSGIVDIAGEVFSARAIGKAIDAGDRVIVTDGDIGGLVVRPWSESLEPQSLPKFGELAYDSFGDRVRAKSAKEKADRQAAAEAWQELATKRQWQFGFTFAAVSIWLIDTMLIAKGLPLLQRLLVGFGIFWVAFGWSTVVFRSIDRAIQQFDEEFVRLTSLSTVFALSGSAFGLWSIQSLGIPMGIGVALVATFAGAFVIPILAVIFLGDGG